MVRTYWVSFTRTSMLLCHTLSRAVKLIYSGHSSAPRPCTGVTLRNEFFLELCDLGRVAELSPVQESPVRTVVTKSISSHQISIIVRCDCTLASVEITIGIDADRLFAHDDARIEVRTTICPSFRCNASPRRLLEPFMDIIHWHNKVMVEYRMHALLRRFRGPNIAELALLEVIRLIR